MLLPATAVILKTAYRIATVGDCHKVAFYVINEEINELSVDFVD